jgi:hypothetical protein
VLRFYQWIHVNKRGGSGAFDVSQSNRCAVFKRWHFRARLNGTTHAKARVRIAKTAILIE